MHRIDSSTAAADKFGTGKDGFNEAVPGSVPATELTEDWLDGVQEELCNVIEAADVTLVKNTRDQLHDALNIMINRASVMGIWSTVYNPKGYALNGVIWDSDSGYWVAVGDADGTDAYVVRTLAPGVDWAESANASNFDLQAIATSGTGYIVAVGKSSGSSPYIIQSINGGSTWYVRTATNADLYGIAYGHSLFVAVGLQSTSPIILTSTIGTTWLSRTVPCSERLYCIAYSSSLDLFCATGEVGTDLAIVTSPDGVTWTERSNSLTAVDATSICWSEFAGLFVLVGYDTGTYPLVATSPDGITWTQRTDANGLLDTSHLYKVFSIESAKILVAFGVVSSDENASKAYFSRDGITWTFRHIPGDDPTTGHLNTIRGLAEDPDRCVLVACGDKPSGAAQGTLLRCGATNLAVENM